MTAALTAHPLIEIKRDRTPREVVAQALDYACWVDRLRAEHPEQKHVALLASGINFVDLQGGSALDTATLTQMRETDALVQVVRGFADEVTGEDYVVTREWNEVTGQFQQTTTYRDGDCLYGLSSPHGFREYFCPFTR